ncbi:MAG TPA: hypothetical protein VF698_14680, partial [Thermoanaerobaculia bacterium]
MSILDLPFTEARDQVSPREYAEAAVRAIRERDGDLHAFLHVNDGASGWPVAIKDNIVTTDMPT